MLGECCVACCCGPHPFGSKKRRRRDVCGMDPRLCTDAARELAAPCATCCSCLNCRQNRPAHHASASMSSLLFLPSASCSSPPAVAIDPAPLSLLPSALFVFVQYMRVLLELDGARETCPGPSLHQYSFGLLVAQHTAAIVSRRRNCWMCAHV
ncbi:hypothetical protein GQ54DRAFT_51088 [Martensiomyces pterosporus]|nr:hypothetical protein GQ54DRAFT_51088 [Martensiomyces pterosporus]